MLSEWVNNLIDIIKGSIERLGFEQAEKQLDKISRFISLLSGYYIPSNDSNKNVSIQKLIKELRQHIYDKLNKEIDRYKKIKLDDTDSIYNPYSHPTPKGIVY